MRKSNGLLALILLAHIALGVIFNTSTPIFEAPDEDGHYLFVRYLQVFHTLPVQDLDMNGPRAHHPPLYHILGALLTAWVPVQSDSARRIDMQGNPKAYFRYDDPERDNKAMWVHYGPEELWPYSGQALVVHLVRALSLAFSALGVLFTYLAARPLRAGWEGERLGLLAAALVALHPMVLFMSGVLQNNTTMLAAGGSVVYVLSLGLRRGFTWRTWLALGILLGLGVLLQLSSLVLAAPIGLALLYVAFTSAPARRPALGLSGWRVLLGGGLALAVPMALLTGWWFLRNRALYGDWTGNNIVAQMWCCDPIQPWPALRLFLTGLLGRFGQGLMITYPNPIYYAAAVVALVALAGWVVAWRQRGKASERAGEPVEVKLPALALSGWVLHLGVIATVCGALVFYAATVAPGLPGRYLFPAFPSLAVVVAGGWLAWFPSRPALGFSGWRSAGALALAGLTLAATLYAIYGLLLPTYAPPPTVSAGELSRAATLDANIGDTAQVLGYMLDSPSVKPGGILQVTVYWQPLSRTDVPYTVFLQLYDPAQGVLAQIDSYPGLGNYATTVWDVGRPIVDVYRLKIPADAPTATAHLVFGLYNGNDGVRLPVTGSDAGPADLAWVQFASVTVAP